MSRAQPIRPSPNHRRSGTPKPFFGRASVSAGSHRATSRLKSSLVEVAATVPPRRLLRRELDDTVIQQRTARFERVRHRRAIDFDEDVAGQVVMLIPALEPAEQRSPGREQIRDGVVFRQLVRVAAITSGVDDASQQIVGEHRSPPDEPGLRPKSERLEPALAAHVRRQPPRAETRPGPASRDWPPSSNGRAPRRTADIRQTARRRRHRSDRRSRAAWRARRRRRSESPTRRQTVRRSESQAAPRSERSRASTCHS